MPGPTVPLASSRIGIFSLFFTTSLLQYIVLQTNQYALECMGGEKFHKWASIHGVYDIDGHMPPALNMWLLENWWVFALLTGGQQNLSRFFHLHHYLHFVENSSLSPPGSSNYDKLGKIQPMLSTTFQSIYHPHMNTSVDEAMIPFKGQLSLKQYMPKKLVRRGIKVWAISDATNGFVSQL